MDLIGSVVDTNVRIYPSQKLISFIQTFSEKDNVPTNVLKFIKTKSNLNKQALKDTVKQISIQLNNKDIENLKKIKDIVSKFENTKSLPSESGPSSDNSSEKDLKEIESNESTSETREKSGDETINDDEFKEKESNDENPVQETKVREGPYLTTSDLDWLYMEIVKLRSQSTQSIPYLHELMEDSEIAMPENKVIKRNPVLEARCVKLRAQQEAREYRKMTRGVDNVRVRFPEDSIAYQLKQLNRQLIAIVQFLLSIFSGFLFGFKGIEWMIGYLDFGVRLLLGVMCALIIALAEIYFLAKKLNEELNVPETVQLGGPPKFVDESTNKDTLKIKEHQD